MNDQFSDEERRVFKYRVDRDSEVFGDPIAISHGMSRSLDGEFNATLRKARGADLPRDDTGKLIKPEAPHEVVERLEAHDRLLIAVREVFGMTPYDKTTGRGALSDDCDVALNCFLKFVAKKNEMAANLQT